jgi:carboxymethylenebutenolidase
VDPAVRIQPDVVHVAAGSRSVPAHALWLGGIPRGAVLLLLDAETADYDGAEAMNEFAGHGYESLAAVVTGADDEDEHDLIDALVGQLGERGWSDEQIGVVGFGSGGRTALIAAARGGFGGAVSVAPTGMASLLAEPDRLGAGAGVSTPWLGMFGTEDADVSREVLSTLVTALGPQSPIYTELVRYPGVAGGFYRDSHRPLVHAAAFDSWQRIIEWLDARVAPRLTPLAEAWRSRHPVDH